MISMKALKRVNREFSSQGELCTLNKHKDRIFCITIRCELAGEPKAVQKS